LKRISLPTLLCLAALLLLAASVRLHGLTRENLWEDELSNLVRLTEGPFSRSIAEFPRHAVYAALLRVVASFSRSDLAFRCLSAVLGILSVACLSFAALHLFNRKIAILAGALLALSAFHVEYSQEVHAYALLTLWSPLLFWFGARFLLTGRWGWMAGYSLVGLTAMYSHLNGAVLLAALCAGFPLAFLVLKTIKRAPLGLRPFVKRFLLFAAVHVVLLALYYPVLQQWHIFEKVGRVAEFTKARVTGETPEKDIYDKAKPRVENYARLTLPYFWTIYRYFEKGSAVAAVLAGMLILSALGLSLPARTRPPEPDRTFLFLSLLLVFPIYIVLQAVLLRYLRFYFAFRWFTIALPLWNLILSASIVAFAGGLARLWATRPTARRKFVLLGCAVAGLFLFFHSRHVWDYHHRPPVKPLYADTARYLQVSASQDDLVYAKVPWALPRYGFNRVPVRTLSDQDFDVTFFDTDRAWILCPDFSRLMPAQQEAVHRRGLCLNRFPDLFGRETLVRPLVFFLLPEGAFVSSHSFRLPASAVDEVKGSVRFEEQGLSLSPGSQCSWRVDPPLSDVLFRQPEAFDWIVRASTKGSSVSLLLRVDGEEAGRIGPFGAGESERGISGLVSAGRHRIELVAPEESSTEVRVAWIGGEKPLPWKIEEPRVLVAGLEMLGHWRETDFVQPGGFVNETLYLRAVRPTEKPFRLIGLARSLAGRRESTAVREFCGGYHPVPSWQPGEIIAESVRIPVPKDATPGFWDIRAGLLDSKRQAALAFLGTVEVTESPLDLRRENLSRSEEDLPRRGQEVNLRFGEIAELLSYEIRPRSPRYGRPLELIFAWRCVTPPSGPVRVGAHLMPEDHTESGRPHFDFWPDPPMNEWEPGRVYVTRVRQNLPDAGLPGVFALHVFFIQEQGGKSYTCPKDSADQQVDRFGHILVSGPQ